MIVGRKRTTLIAALLVTGAFGLQAAASAQPAPRTLPTAPKVQPGATKPRTQDLDAVKKKVAALYDQAEAASERFNASRLQLRDSKVELTALRSDVRHQQAVVGRMRDEVAALVVQQYQGHTLSTASRVVLSDSPKAFLDNLNAASSFDTQRGQVVSQYRVELKRLTLRQRAAADQVAALDRTQRTLLAEKQTIDKKAAAAKAVLNDLEAKQREALLAGDSSSLPTVSASGRAAAAIQYAMAQVGKPYVFGAAGPGAFDCSGLMMAAWARAGVGLPHSSSAQMGSGRRVSESELRPGDLVFYYSPVHHVGMYIGNGMIVNAENPSVGVRVTGLHSMPYSGAVRVG